MSEIIDIEIVVDTQNLVQSTPNPSQDPTKPTWVAHNFAYMIASAGYVRSGQATGDLSISTDVGDVIRWRMISLSGNTNYSANLDNITYLSGNNVTAPATGFLTQPQTTEPGTTPGPITLPPKFVTTPQFDYYVDAAVIASGTQNYSVLFQVLSYDKGTLKSLGYFAWDPTLTAF